ncbi:MAG: hypothetical protein WA979_04930 [Pacificimonas sp.]
MTIRKVAVTVLLPFLPMAACSGAAESDGPPRTEQAQSASFPRTQKLTGAPAMAPESPEDAPAGTSAILGRTDLTLRGEPACDIRFAYAGEAPETLFWEEPCADISVDLVTEAELKAAGQWDRLDSFARDSVASLPGGEVLYVEGSFSASVYPLGVNHLTYEVPVID